MKRNKGFTLVELAIVLVIIGLILAAVMKGQELILNAKLKRTLKQAQAAVAAAQTFNDYTDKWPGGISGVVGTDLCSLGIVRLVDSNGNAYCAQMSQKAFEFWGAKNNGADGSQVRNKNNAVVGLGIWLDGIGRNTQGCGTNPDADALYVVYSQNAPVVCFMQDDCAAGTVTSESQRKAMLSIAKTFAGADKYMGVNCVGTGGSSHNACVGAWSEVFEHQWETQGTFTPANTTAQTRLHVCVRIKQ